MKERQSLSETRRQPQSGNPWGHIAWFITGTDLRCPEWNFNQMLVILNEKQTKRKMWLSCKTFDSGFFN